MAPKIAKSWNIDLGFQCGECYSTSTKAVLLDKIVFFKSVAAPAMVCVDCHSAFELQNKKINKHILDVYENNITKEQFYKKIEEHLK